MIIKPLESISEFEAYGSARFGFTGARATNTAKAPQEHEFDAYDRDSFHFGAFQDGVLHACARMVNDTKGTQKFALDQRSIENLERLSVEESPANGLALQDYVHASEFDEVDSFFQSFRDQHKSFNEIGRLIRHIKDGEKYLMNYLICYAYAFSRFYGIDYCFFETPEVHFPYYEQSFHCKRVLPEVTFNPMAGGETFYLMQATGNDLPPQMDAVANYIHDRFKEAGAPCPIQLSEIR